VSINSVSGLTDGRPEFKYSDGIVIAQIPGTSPKTLQGVKAGEVSRIMLEYMKRLTLAKQDCPTVLSITDTTVKQAPTVIHRNNVRKIEPEASADIYMRAREIYFRARRQRPVRAISIF